MVSFGMKKKLTFCVLVSIFLIGWFPVQVMSHSGTMNEIVKARMASMKVIAPKIKSLSKIS